LRKPVIARAASAAHPDSSVEIARREEIAMKLNEGVVDRGIRVLVGLVLISLVFVGPQTPWGWIGVVPLVTGIIGWCPAYTLLGINTCPRRT
jgi:hypothetical protein